MSPSLAGECSVGVGGRGLFAWRRVPWRFANYQPAQITVVSTSAVVETENLWVFHFCLFVVVLCFCKFKNDECSISFISPHHPSHWSMRRVGAEREAADWYCPPETQRIIGRQSDQQRYSFPNGHSWLASTLLSPFHFHSLHWRRRSSWGAIPFRPYETARAPAHQGPVIRAFMDSMKHQFMIDRNIRSKKISVVCD